MDESLLFSTILGMYFSIKRLIGSLARMFTIFFNGFVVHDISKNVNDLNVLPTYFTDGPYSKPQGFIAMYLLLRDYNRDKTIQIRATIAFYCTIVEKMP